MHTAASTYRLLPPELVRQRIAAAEGERRALRRLLRPSLAVAAEDARRRGEFLRREGSRGR